MTATGIDFGTTNSVVAQWLGDDADVLLLDATTSTPTGAIPASSTSSRRLWA